MNTSPTATTQEGGDRRSSSSTRRVEELIFALAVVSLGIYTSIASRSIPEPVSAGSVGPRALPLLVGILMIVVGLLVAAQVLRGHAGQAEDSEDIDTTSRTDWATVSKIVVVFVVHIVLIRPAGWPIAAAVLFIGAAWALGSRPIQRVVAIGVALALLIQLVFAGWLGVSLPPGPLLEGVPFLNG